MKTTSVKVSGAGMSRKDWLKSTTSETEKIKVPKSASTLQDLKEELAHYKEQLTKTVMVAPIKRKIEKLEKQISKLEKKNGSNMKTTYVKVVYDKKSGKMEVEDLGADLSKDKKKLSDAEFEKLLKKNLKKYAKDLKYLEDR